LELLPMALSSQADLLIEIGANLDQYTKKTKEAKKIHDTLLMVLGKQELAYAKKIAAEISKKEKPAVSA